MRQALDQPTADELPAHSTAPARRRASQTSVLLIAALALGSVGFTCWAIFRSDDPRLSPEAAQAVAEANAEAAAQSPPAEPMHESGFSRGARPVSK